MSSNVVAALIAGGVSIVVSIVAAVGSFRLQRSKLREELRRLLIRAGAVCFEGKDGVEMWGLRTRNEDRLA